MLTLFDHMETLEKSSVLGTGSWLFEAYILRCGRESDMKKLKKLMAKKNYGDIKEKDYFLGDYAAILASYRLIYPQSKSTSHCTTTHVHFAYGILWSIANWNAVSFLLSNWDRSKNLRSKKNKTAHQFSYGDAENDPRWQSYDMF